MAAAQNGEQVLSEKSLRPHARGDVQSGWQRSSATRSASHGCIRDLGDVRMVGHGGSTHGQRAAFQMVPERNFAVVVLTNSVPNGAQLHGALVKWSLERYLGIVSAATGAAHALRRRVVRLRRHVRIHRLAGTHLRGGRRAHGESRSSTPTHSRAPARARRGRA